MGGRASRCSVLSGRLECRCEAIAGPCGMRRSGKKSQAAWARAGGNPCVLQQILISLRAQESKEKFSRDITSLHPGFAAIEHGRSKIRVTCAEPFCFFKEDESDQLLSGRSKAVAIAKTDEKESLGGNRARLGHDEKCFPQGPAKQAVSAKPGEQAAEVLINFRQ